VTAVPAFDGYELVAALPASNGCAALLFRRAPVKPRPPVTDEDPWAACPWEDLVLDDDQAASLTPPTPGRAPLLPLAGARTDPPSPRVSWVCAWGDGTP
jgi:hypothetical protein